MILLPQIQPGPRLLRAGLRQRLVGLGCRSLRCRLRDPGPGSARGPRNRVQFARARDRPLSQASDRQRDLRGDVERPGDHHPPTEPVFRTHCHGTFGRQPAPISQRSQNGDATSRLSLLALFPLLRTDSLGSLRRWRPPVSLQSHETRFVGLPPARLLTAYQRPPLRIEIADP